MKAPAPASVLRPALMALTLWLSAVPLSAGVVEVEVERREAVLDGRPFGDAGAYEKIVGRIRFAFDPESEYNEAIVDLDRAPRNDEGLVEAWANFMVLQPRDPALRRGVAWVEVSNRGGKASIRYFNAGTGARDPVTEEDFGNGLLMRQGLTLIWVGWQWSVPPLPDAMHLVGPILEAEEGGKPITGLARADWTVDEATDVLTLAHRPGLLAYPPYEPDSDVHRMTVRDSRDGPRRDVPRQSWRFVANAPDVEANRVAAQRAHREAARQAYLAWEAARAAGEDVPEEFVPPEAPALAPEPASDEPQPPAFVELDGGFEAGRIYELVYEARDARVVGLGLAVIRDVISYAKHDPGSLFPVEKGVAFGVSQTGRFLRHFLYQGFNVDEEGRTAYDGMLIHTAGAGRGSFNHRFGQPSRDGHRYSSFFYPTDVFPFTSRTQRDPVLDLEDGLLDRTPEEHRPLTFFTNTGYEYWGRAAALIHHDTGGDRDVEPLPTERIYHLTAGQHFVGAWPPPEEGRMNQGYRGNPVDFLVNLRALAVDLVEWVADGVAPPPSAYPTLADSTLVPYREVRYPSIPGFVANRTIHNAYRVDYGDRWAEGIVDLQPPRIMGKYPSLVSDVDEVGNEVAGIRPVEVRVPLATFLPWNLRRGYAGGTDEMTDFVGTFFPLAATENVKMIRADPRPSLEALYGSRNAFLDQVRRSAAEMIEERLLLEEDVDRVVARATAMWSWIMGG